MHYCGARLLHWVQPKNFLLRLLLFTQGLRGRFLGFVLVVRQAVADLMLASDVMDYLGNSRRRRNTSGSY